VTQKRDRLSGSLPHKHPNKHRMNSWQPPFTYHPEDKKKLTRQQRSDMLKYYNSQLEKHKREMYDTLKASRTR